MTGWQMLGFWGRVLAVLASLAVPAVAVLRHRLAETFDRVAADHDLIPWAEEGTPTDG